MRVLRRSFDEAHKTILAKEGGLTTMCACLICPVSNSDQYAVCCVNVGDSFAFVFSHNNGIREVTIGSHDVKCERDIRDAGGALGPVDGNNPELHNLTCSLTFGNNGDIVFLTTDGVSDNFDPVVTKIALPKIPNETNLNEAEKDPYVLMHSKPEMSPRERHIYSMKEMERIVHEYELIMEEEVSAQELCSAMVQHILTLTDSKRKILENPALYARRKMTSTERQRRDSEIVEKMSKAPGKLDHASIVAVEVGAFLRKEKEEEEEAMTLNDNRFTSNANTIGLNTLTLPTSGSPKSPQSPTSPSTRKSGARRFFSRLKNLPSPTSTTPSPTSTTLLPGVTSPRKEAKRQISRSTSHPGSPQSPTIPESRFESPCELSAPVISFPSRRQRSGAACELSPLFLSRSAPSHAGELSSPRGNSPLHAGRPGELSSPRGNSPLHAGRPGELSFPRGNSPLHAGRPGELSFPRGNSRLHAGRSGELSPPRGNSPLHAGRPGELSFPRRNSPLHAGRTGELSPPRGNSPLHAGRTGELSPSNHNSQSHADKFDVDSKLFSLGYQPSHVSHYNAGRNLPPPSNTSTHSELPSRLSPPLHNTPSEAVTFATSSERPRSRLTRSQSLRLPSRSSANSKSVCSARYVFTPRQQEPPGQVDDLCRPVCRRVISFESNV